jgi:hypothetical protein
MKSRLLRIEPPLLRRIVLPEKEKLLCQRHKITSDPPLGWVPT